MPSLWDLKPVQLVSRPNCECGRKVRRFLRTTTATQRFQVWSGNRTREQSSSLKVEVYLVPVPLTAWGVAKDGPRLPRLSLAGWGPLGTMPPVSSRLSRVLHAHPTFAERFQPRPWPCPWRQHGTAAWTRPPTAAPSHAAAAKSAPGRAISVAPAAVPMPCRASPGMRASHPDPAELLLARTAHPASWGRARTQSRLPFLPLGTMRTWNETFQRGHNAFPACQLCRPQTDSGPHLGGWSSARSGYLSFLEAPTDHSPLPPSFPALSWHLRHPRERETREKVSEQGLKVLAEHPKREK